MFAALLVAAHAPSVFAADPSVKVAFWNVRSGHGISALPGHSAPFVNTTNCTDPSQPLNAWGVGATQAALAQLAADPSVIALGLGESWYSVCASPDKVRTALGWKATTGEQNGVALVARHGFAGPETWLQLDTTLNTTPGDTMWVLRAPVCLDATCSTSMPVYVAHWYGTGTYGATSYSRQAQQTAAFLASTSNGQPHVFVGDLNVWEGTSKVCNQSPNNTTLSYLRSAGYSDAWLTIHGGAEGFTGMINRAGCGYPEGYAWKRIDYAWTPASYQPTGIERFAMVPPGDASPSDHYGIVVTLPYPGTPAPAPAPEPTTTTTSTPTTTTTTTTTSSAPATNGNIVLHAKNAAITGTAWTVVSDASAAGGARLANADAGVPKLAAPFAEPASYVEIPFAVEPGRAYRLWIRGRAQNDAWQNDSTFVQFSGSVDSAGAPVFRIGTTSATVVSIEEGSGAGVSAWGWQDNGYGFGVLGQAIYFAGASQRLRIQVREDGLSIDQIVLSPVQYATTAPGAGKNDATILPEATGIVTTISSAPIAAWTALKNTTTDGITIRKTSGCGECSDGGGITPLADPASVQFTVAAGHRLVVGLGRDTSTNTDYRLIDFGFNIWESGWDIREAGIYRTEGALAAGDVFKIATEAGVVRYYVNTRLVYTSGSPAPSGLVLDATLQTIGSSVTVVR